MTLLQILSILGTLGVPSIFVIIVGCYKFFKKRNSAVKSGLQALLRSQMINDYNNWNEKQYAPIYARENFENCWEQYHELGANGVMDDIHKKFMDLPTDPPKKNYDI